MQLITDENNMMIEPEYLCIERKTADNIQIKRNKKKKGFVR